MQVWVAVHSFQEFYCSLPLRKYFNKFRHFSFFFSYSQLFFSAYSKRYYLFFYAKINSSNIINKIQLVMKVQNSTNKFMVEDKRASNWSVSNNPLFLLEVPIYIRWLLNLLYFGSPTSWHSKVLSIIRNSYLLSSSEMHADHTRTLLLAVNVKSMHY